MKISLSIIVPCYNEAKNIPHLVKRIDAHKPKDVTFELVLVDNGSKDETRSVIQALMKKHSYITLAIVEKNQGYGWGILSGLKKSKGEYVCWTHADIQTDILDTIKAYRIIQKSADPKHTFVKGKRKGRSFMDQLFSTGNAAVVSVLLRKALVEINAQPNLFHRNLLQGAKAPKDWGIELYFYYLAKKRNYHMERFPVLFTKRLHGTSNWNTGMKAKFAYIQRAIQYTLQLRKQKIN